MFVAKIQFSCEGKLEFDIILISAKTWAEAIEYITNFYQDDLLTIHYLEPWEDIVVIDEDFFHDINIVKEA